MGKRICGSAVVVFVLAVNLVLAQEPSLPLRNWTAPAAWTPPAVSTPAGKGMVASVQTDTSFPLPFVPVTPCRIVDTRINVADGFHEPNFSDDETRTFSLPNSPDCTGLPFNTGAWSLNVQFRPIAQASYITLFPTGTTRPVVSTLTATPAGFTADAAVVPAGTVGKIDVYCQYAGRLVIDINGYYTQNINSNEYFGIEGSFANGGIIWGYNHYTAGIAFGGNFAANSGADGSAGAHGVDNADPSGPYGISGVLGTTASTAPNAAGVRGAAGAAFLNSACCGAVGVRGEGAFNGVAGVSQDRATVGVLVDTSGDWLAEGQLGKIGSSATQAYGVVGLSSGTAFNTAAVLGRMTGDRVLQTASSPVFGFLPGLRGESSDIGVLGLGNVRGVQGNALTTNGDDAGWGVLGFNGGATTYGVIGLAANSGATNWGVYAEGNLGASGTKPFVEPDREDPTKEVRYVALEGPEAGTYFRGKGQFQRGEATIEVPESFRLVTDADGLSIQVTPVGDFASVYVESIGLDKIVVRSNKDVAFFFTVNGVRHTFRDWQVMAPSDDYRPFSEAATMPESLAPEQKRYLIQNGTYNEDGTVNMDTAERLGWAQEWRERATTMKAVVAATATGTVSAKGGDPSTQQP
jgi:hypothetical protein